MSPPRAKKMCGRAGCTRIVPNGVRYCDEHRRERQWQGSSISREDDNARRRLRSKILARDPHCKIGYADICTGTATEVDRIDNNLGYTWENLQGSCRSCNQRKASMEGHLALGHRVELPPAAQPRPTPRSGVAQPNPQIPRTL